MKATGQKGFFCCLLKIPRTVYGSAKAPGFRGDTEGRKDKGQPHRCYKNRALLGEYPKQRALSGIENEVNACMANSWSGLRKQLENEFLCPQLRGRVQYFLTHYHNAHDDYGRIAIRVDGKEYLWGNPYAYYEKGYAALENRIKRENQIPPREWSPKGTLHERENREIENHVKSQAIHDGVLEIGDITKAIRIYTQSPIRASLQHDSPLVRLLAILDYRVGKRTLLKVRDTLESQPQWLQFFYRLRLEAMGLAVPQKEQIHPGPLAPSLTGTVRK